MLGHCCYLTCQSLMIITTHLTIAALTDIVLDPLVSWLLPAPVLRGALLMHGASHMHSEWVCALSCVLSLLFYPLTLLPKWEADEVAPWRKRGVLAYKALQLYSHGAAVPCTLFELLLLKNRHLLAQLAPAFSVLATVSVVYGSAYPLSVHVGYNLHELRVQALQRGKEEAALAAAVASGALPRIKSNPGHAWPYSFMDDLTQLGKPPARLHSWGVRPPFSAGWVLLALTGTATNLLVLLCVRRFHVGA